MPHMVLNEHEKFRGDWATVIQVITVRMMKNDNVPMIK